MAWSATANVSTARNGHQIQRIERAVRMVGAALRGS
jgi:hypothetical protein